MPPSEYPRRQKLLHKAVLFFLAVLPSRGQKVLNKNSLYSDKVIKIVEPEGSGKPRFSGNEILSDPLKQENELAKIAEVYRTKEFGVDEEKHAKKLSKMNMIVKAQESMGLPNYDLQAIAEMKSTWDYSERFSNTTIILNHWKRDSLHLQLDAILEMSVKPVHIWVAVFDSPNIEKYRATVQRYRDRFPPGALTLTESDYNFKYYGRFQMALQAHTEYVWIVDDDIVPGPRTLALFTHALNVPDLRAGVLGTIGWVMPPLNEYERAFDSYRGAGAKGGLYFEDPHYNIRATRLIKADLVCSHWFLRADHVRVVFREKWVTYETAEDYQLSYSMRRYANLESYVLPSIAKDPSTWGNLDVEQGIMREHATTVHNGEVNMPALRDHIWWNMALRAGKFHWLLFRHHVRQQPGYFDAQRDTDRSNELNNLALTADKARYPPSMSVILLIDGMNEATAAANLQNDLATQWKSMVSVEQLTVFTGGKRGPCLNAARRMLFYKDREAQYCDGEKFGLFDLKFGHSFDRHITPVELYLELYSGLNELFDILGTSPQEVPFFFTLEPAASQDSLWELAAQDASQAGLLASMENDGPSGEDWDRKVIRRAARDACRHRGVRRAPLRPHEVDAAAALGVLQPDALRAWADVSFTIILEHSEPSGDLWTSLSALDGSYFIGDSVDLIIILGSSVTEEDRDLADYFSWSLGHKTVVRSFVNDPRSRPEALLESFFSINPEKSFVVTLDTKVHTHPAFYLWAKGQALAHLVKGDPASTMCFVNDCTSAFNNGAVPADLWNTASQMCAEVITKDGAAADCTQVLARLAPARSAARPPPPPSGGPGPGPLAAAAAPLASALAEVQDLYALLPEAVKQVPERVEKKVLKTHIDWDQTRKKKLRYSTKKRPAVSAKHAIKDSDDKPLPKKGDYVLKRRKKKPSKKSEHD